MCTIIEMLLTVKRKNKVVIVTQLFMVDIYKNICTSCATSSRNFTNSSYDIPLSRYHGQKCNNLKSNMIALTAPYLQ